jgi:predicted nucleic acid-binding protein
VIVVDSSGWIEFFTDGPLADEFAPYLEDLAEVVTPTIVIFEVYRVIRRQRSEEEAIAAVAQMQKTSVVDLDQFLALSAADVSIAHRLAMADAIVYATALSGDIAMVTADAHFQGLDNARVLPSARER